MDFAAEPEAFTAFLTGVLAGAEALFLCVFGLAGAFFTAFTAFTAFLLALLGLLALLALPALVALLALLGLLALLALLAFLAVAMAEKGSLFFAIFRTLFGIESSQSAWFDVALQATAPASGLSPREQLGRKGVA